MSFLKLIFVVLVWFPLFSMAAFPCPPDSCNPHNGCTDGCNGGGSQQRICSDNSHSSCQKREMYSSCRYTYIDSEGEEVAATGVCHPVGVINSTITCGCR